MIALHLAYIHIKHEVRNVANTAGWALFVFFVLFVFMHLWQVLYAESQLIKGFTYAQMIWYIALAEVAVFAVDVRKIEHISETIRTGDFAMQLLKPISFPGYHFTLLISDYLFRVVVMGCIVTVMAWLLVGSIPITWSLLPLSIAIVLLGGVIGVSITLLLSLTAMLSEDASAFYWLYEKALFILGGMLVPISIYPDAVYHVLTYLPFAYVVFFPIQTVVQQKAFISTILGQLMWVVLCIVAIHIMHATIVRRVQINGG